MKASETNLGKIAERTAQYLVPLFQRPYSWEKRQWQELLTDLIDLYDSEGSHFIGSIVVTDIASKPKDLTYYYLLIDGQQHLTTLFVILILLRDIAENKIPTKIKRLLTNEVVEGLEHFTLLPTQQDREVFISLIKKECSDVPNDHLLAKCYSFFKKGIRNLDCEKLYEVICSRLSIVEIVLESDDNPYVVFESLNAKGRSLTQADLIRNYFLMRISQASQDEIYKSYWLPMQEALGDNLTQFMRHYLASDGIIVRKDGIYLKLKEKIDLLANVLEPLEKIRTFSLFYEKLIDPSREEDEIVRANLFRINRLNYTVMYPFLLNCYNEYEHSSISKDEFINILKTLENFVVRRLVCNIPTSGLNKIFPILYADAKKESASNLIDGVKIKLGKKNEYPRDNDFCKDILRTSFSPVDERTKLILETIEIYLREQNSEDTNIFKFSSYKVEPVMPESINSEWEKELGDDWQQYYYTYKQVLSNLTLVPLDCNLNNKSYSHKKYYFSQSGLLLNSYFQSADRWDKAAIENRAKVLADICLEIWSCFASIKPISYSDDVTGTKPTKLIIAGDEYQVTHWKDVYIETLKWIQEYSPESFDEISNRFPSFITDAPRSLKESYDLQNGYFAELRLNSKAIYRFCEQVMRLDIIRELSEDWSVEREN